MNTPKNRRRWIDIAWDAWCICSLVGIWPRFIEPRLIKTTYVNIFVPRLPTGLEGLRIAQFSDLHIHAGVSTSYLDRIRKKILGAKPDLIVFTGDFLCYGAFTEADKLKNFLRSLPAPYGNFAILGNHDYEEPISINEHGEYDIVESKDSILKKAFKRLFNKLELKKITTERAKKVPINHQLLSLLAETPFQLLHNASRLIRIGGDAINICGLGEYMADRCDPATAFEYYDLKYPGIILLHNPDGFPKIEPYPGDLVLSGHTHGAQVNLPYLRKKFVWVENPQYVRGLFKINDKSLYVNRGVGSIFSFRWRAIPEITLFKLRRQV